MMGGGEEQVLEEAKLYYNQHYNAARQSSSKASGAAKSGSSPLRSLTGGIHVAASERERGVGVGVGRLHHVHHMNDANRATLQDHSCEDEDARLTLLLLSVQQACRGPQHPHPPPPPSPSTATPSSRFPQNYMMSIRCDSEALAALAGKQERRASEA